MPSANQQEKSRNLKNKLPILILSVLFTLVILVSVIILSSLLNTSTVYNGVLIQNENIGGYTKENSHNIFRIFIRKHLIIFL